MITRIRSLVQGHSGRVTVGVAGGLALAVVAVVVALLVVVAGPGGTTSATDVIPSLALGNPDCSDSGVGQLIKIEPVADGTFPVPGGEITIVVNNGAKTFDWTSTVAIGLMVVKGGPDANLYLYVPASFADTGLHAPVNRPPRFFGLSHISFCDPGEAATPTPTDTPTPTPTPTDTPTPTATPDECPTPIPGHRDECESPTATPPGPTPTPFPPGRS